MYPIDLEGKRGIVFGVANDRSIAWSIARILDGAGVQLALTYQNERLRERVLKLAGSLHGAISLECDVSDDGQTASVFSEVAERFGGLDFLVHSIAYASRDDLGGDFSGVTREGFRIALDISAYSLIPLVRHAAPLMDNNGGGSIVTMTFQASERVFPGYNIMGTAKAALGERGPSACGGVWGAKHTGERHLGGATGDLGSPGHSRIPGYEESPCR